MKIALSLLFAVGLAPLAFANETSLEVLEEINLARTCPAQYADLLAQRAQAQPDLASARSVGEAVAFLKKMKPMPPLDFSDGLMLSALTLVKDQGARGTTGHAGSNNSRPWDRMDMFGHWMRSAGENISYGRADAKAIVASLIIDEGVPNTGHRQNIFNRTFAVAGIACGSHARYGSMCVIDFAGGMTDLGGRALAAMAP